MFGFTILYVLCRTYNTHATNYAFCEALKFGELKYLKSYAIVSPSETGSRCHINAYRRVIIITSEHGNVLRPAHESASSVRAISERNSWSLVGYPSKKGQSWRSLIFYRGSPRKCIFWPNKESRNRWFETPRRSCDVTVMCNAMTVLLILSTRPLWHILLSTFSLFLTKLRLKSNDGFAHLGLTSMVKETPGVQGNIRFAMYMTIFLYAYTWGYNYILYSNYSPGHTSCIAYVTGLPSWAA